MQPSPSVLAWATAVMPGDEAASWCKEESLLEGWWVAAAVVPGGGGCPGAAAPSPLPPGPSSSFRRMDPCSPQPLSFCRIAGRTPGTVSDIIRSNVNDGGWSQKEAEEFS